MRWLLLTLLLLIGSGCDSGTTDQEKQDYERALLLEKRHELDKGGADLCARTGDKAGEREARARMKEAERDHFALITKYPRWGRSPLKP